MKENFDLITFDCYGTLIDWERGIVGAFEAEAARQQTRLDPDQVIATYMVEEPGVEATEYKPYRTVLDETARRVAARLGWQIPPDRTRFLSNSLIDWLPFPDTNPALERLAQHFQLGILSNVDDDLLEGTRKHFTVNFDFIVTAQQVRSYKPGHAHFKEARRRAAGKRQLHAARSYFHDVVPATALGIDVVWVNRKGELAMKDGPRPNHEVRNLTELADLLGV